MLDIPLTPYENVRQLLDRAHSDALNAYASDLRLTLEEARDLLQGLNPDLAARLTKALVDFNSGALAEMESLLESVRKDLEA
jgi:hypothetical protein